MYCEHPNVGYNLMDGTSKTRSCLLTRYDDMCGHEARWFDPKPSLKEKIWNILKLK